MYASVSKVCVYMCVSVSKDMRVSVSVNLHAAVQKHACECMLCICINGCIEKLLAKTSP